MAEEKKQDAAAEKSMQEVMLRVLAQYVKDSSFESPSAPDSLRGGQPAPSIDLNIEVKANPQPEDFMEVILMVTVRAMREEQIVFIAELQYAGLFQFGSDIEAQMLEPLVLIECPRMLFPFARQIISEMTQQGGFQPLMLEPLDFSALYRAKKMQEAGAQAEAGEASVN